MMRRYGAKKQRRGAQVSVEFLFCMVMVLLMIYGSIYIFRWTGVDLAERRIAHDAVIGALQASPAERTQDAELYQVDPYFYKPIDMNAIWRGTWTW